MGRAIEGKHARSLEELSASIAHEIRNPITAAKSLVQQMGEDPQSAAAAAKALGEIGTSEAAKALAAARGKGPAPVQQAVADGTMICADRLVAAGQRSPSRSMCAWLPRGRCPL